MMILSFLLHIGFNGIAFGQTIRTKQQMQDRAWAGGSATQLQSHSYSDGPEYRRVLPEFFPCVTSANMLNSFEWRVR